MSSILDVSSIYNTYSQSVTSANASSLQSTLNGMSGDTEDEQLMEACKGFESYFVQKIIEQAKSTIGSEEDEGEYMQYFGDILNQQYADLITQGGSFGLAQQLYDSIKG